MERTRKTEISKLQMTVLANEEVFRLDIAMDDALGVEVLQSHDDFGGVAADGLQVERAAYGQHGGEVAAPHELHDEEQLLHGLERVVQLDNERVVDVGEDGQLSRHAGQPLLGLANHFEREQVRRRFFTHQKNAAKAALGNGLDDLKVGDGGLGAARIGERRVSDGRLSLADEAKRGQLLGGRLRGGFHQLQRFALAGAGRLGELLRGGLQLAQQPLQLLHRGRLAQLAVDGLQQRPADPLAVDGAVALEQRLADETHALVAVGGEQPLLVDAHHVEADVGVLQKDWSCHCALADAAHQLLYIRRAG